MQILKARDATERRLTKTRTQLDCLATSMAICSTTFYRCRMLILRMFTDIVLQIAGNEKAHLLDEGKK